jgi:hypothetical protein
MTNVGTPYSLLRTNQTRLINEILTEVHCLSQRVFSTKCDPLLPLSIFNILSLTSGHPEAAYAFFLFFPQLYPSLCLSFNNVF